MQSKIAYQGNIPNSGILKGSFSVPDSMLELEGNTISTVKLLTILDQFLQKQHPQTAIRTVVDLAISIRTSDGLEGAISLPKGFHTEVGIKIQLEKIVSAEEKAEATKQSKISQKLGYIKCPKCNGLKEVQTKQNNLETCRRCNGTGLIFDKDALDEQKDARLPEDKRKRIEQESEDAAFRSFSRKR